MSKDDLNQNEESVSQMNADSEEVAPKKKAVRKKTAVKKEAVDATDTNVHVDGGSNGRFEFSPDDESDRSHEANQEGSTEMKSAEASGEKETNANENRSFKKKHNEGGNNRSKNANRNHDRGGKNNRSKHG